MTALMISIQSVMKTRLRVVALPEISPETTKAYHRIRSFSEGQLTQQLTEKEKDHWVKLARDIAATGSWVDLRPRELKNIASCLWYGDDFLATDENFLKDFLKACKDRIKKSICNVLIGAYLRNYEEGKPGIILLGEWLEKTVVNWDWRWSDRQKEFSLFSGNDAPHFIADAVINGKESIFINLESYGLSGALQSGGMASAAFTKALMLYKENVSIYDVEENIFRLKRLLNWATLDGKEFSYQKLKGVFIESLLLPWINTAPDEK
ncbi:MAG: hypothetical protein IPJ01_00525 [Micavibrio sp.]|nr:hypothetical protein [Micavibrio sp.]